MGEQRGLDDEYYRIRFFLRKNEIKTFWEIKKEMKYGKHQKRMENMSKGEWKKQKANIEYGKLQLVSGKEEMNHESRITNTENQITDYNEDMNQESRIPKTGSQIANKK